MSRTAASYKIPKQVVFVDALPMTANGKVMKRVLRDQLAAGSGQTGAA